MSKATKVKDGNKVAVVKPLIKVDGETHILEDLFEGDPADLPTMRSIGCMRISPQSNSWISFVITTKGKEVLSIEVSEPNLRAVAQDDARVSFVHLILDQE